MADDGFFAADPERILEGASMLGRLTSLVTGTAATLKASIDGLNLGGDTYSRQVQQTFVPGGNRVVDMLGALGTGLGGNGDQVQSTGRVAANTDDSATSIASSGKTH